MGFSTRKGLRLNEHQSLSPGEYGKMRSINRQALCLFLEEVKQNVIKVDNQDDNKSDKSTGSKKPTKADSLTLGFLK